MTSCPALTGYSASLFQSLISTLFASQCVLNPPSFLPTDYAPFLKNGDTFDFIIIGGGTAGSVLASRLTENSKHRVLLLESGTYPSSTTEIPCLAPTIIGTNEDWNYKTQPSQSSCQGLVNQRCRYALGKMLGGTSSLNFMAYLRGNKRDYDNWQSYGNQGWCWDDVLPYFKKSQDVRNPLLTTNPQYGTGGLLPVSTVEPMSYFNQMKTMAIEFGVPVNNYNSEIGLFETMLTVDKGRRVSTAKAFLGVAKTRTNLFVALNAHVTKIVIEQKIATGVQVKINNKIITVKTNNEVIVSAGSINSVQILMLSGIGPKSHLNNLGITCIEDLPVGENLQDHAVNAGLVVTLDESPEVRKEPIPSAEDIFQYFTEYKGPLSTTGMNMHAFINTKQDSIYPNIFAHFLHCVKKDTHALTNAFEKIGYNQITRNNLLAINENNRMFIVMTGLLNPKSTGNVKLASNDPYAAPIITGNYFSNPADIEIMLETIQVLKQLLTVPSLVALNAKLIKYNIPNCNNLTFDTTPYWQCVLKNFGISMFRPVGTCKMGSAVDRSAVVDNRLKVYGLRNVRVIGGAIMPKIVSAKSHGPTIMIAEKGADLIKQDWGCNTCGN